MINVVVNKLLNILFNKKNQLLIIAILQMSFVLFAVIH